MLTWDEIQGIIPPLATPFTEAGDLDESAFTREIGVMVDAGVHGLVVGGGTGEGYALSSDELARLTTIAVAAVRGRLPVIAGILTTSTRDAIRRGQLAKEAGAQALLVAPTVYGGIPSQDRLCNYYEDVLRSVRLPLLIYNILPQTPVTPRVVAKLLELEGIIGIKESLGGNLDTLQELLHAVGARLAVVCGLDQMLFPAFVLGARASISSLNTLLPHDSVALWQAVQRADLDAARTLHQKFSVVNRMLGRENWIVHLKTVIELQGRTGGAPRRPFTPASPEEREQIAAGLASLGVLPPARARP